MQSSLRLMRATAAAKMALVTLLSGSMLGSVVTFRPSRAQAQIQRSFINPSFESLTFGSTNQQCYVQVSPSIIPGWETTHGSVANGTGSCSGYTSPGNVPLIEIWTTGFSGVSTATTPTSGGRQFAELNAEQNSQLYQNLCLYNGETISFSFLHRGRASTSVPDVANFLIGLITDTSRTIFGQFSTTSNGTVTTQPVAQNGATIPPVTNNNAGNGWVRYSGTVSYTGATGIKPVGFASVSTGNNNNTFGNFLDGVQFAGKPVLEVAASSGGGPESETNPTTNSPKIRIVGLVPTGGLTVAISVAGTAVLGTDFTTPSGTSTINMTIPAGNYDGSNATSLFAIPFNIINNNISQGNRTITFTVQSSSSFLNSSTTTCGNSPIVTSTYTIYDDDIGGTIFNDLNRNKVQNGSEVGISANGLNAVLINSSNQVVANTGVAADGTYFFSNTGSGNYTVQITLATATIGSTPPVVTLPTGWVSTGENLNGTPDAIRDSKVSVSVGSGSVTGANFGIVTGANLLLVKRITAINGDRLKNPNEPAIALNTFVDDPTVNDSNSAWPTNRTSYLLGQVNGGKVKPNDEIEYTIYFLNAGNIDAKNVFVCDRLLPNQTFKTSTYGANQDIELKLGTSTVQYLTAANDSSDRARVIAGSESVTTDCNLKGPNNDGTLVVEMTGNTGIPALTTLPGTTGPGTPNDSYGYIRFTTKVKP